MADVTSSTVGWFPVVTLALGFLAASVTEWLRDSRTSKRERVARRELRRAQLFERRANFQRETLTNLQDAIAKLTRAAGRMYHFDDLEFRKTGKWGGELFPEDLDDAAHNANVSIMVLNSRIRDSRVRDLTEQFRTQANLIGISRTQADERNALEQMTKALEVLHPRIGEVLRTLDDDEEAMP